LGITGLEDMYQYSSQYDTMRHNLPDCDIAVFTKGKALS